MDGQPAEISSIAAPRLRLPLRKPRSLLVEDEVEQLDLRRDLLRLRNLDVIPATSRAEAMSRLRSVDYDVDVVVTDLNLDESTAESGGVDVARAVSEHSGGTIPVYAYSGKAESVPRNERELFRKLVLKASKMAELRSMLEEATSDANAHFKKRAAHAHRIIRPLADTPRQLPPQELSLLRDLMAGAVRTFTLPRIRQPVSVGVVVLPNEAAIPYAIEVREETVGTRYYASVLGHEYLYGYGQSPAEAGHHLHVVIEGFAALVDEEKGTTAVGPSNRLRKLLRAVRGISTTAHTMSD